MDDAVLYILYFMGDDAVLYILKNEEIEAPILFRSIILWNQSARLASRTNSGIYSNYYSCLENV